MSKSTGGLSMVDFNRLAGDVYEYAESNYDKKDARYDVIVGCMTVIDIAEALREAGAGTLEKAKQWADRKAGLMHEVELNQGQCWDCGGYWKLNPVGKCEWCSRGEAK